MSKLLDPTWPERHRRELGSWMAGSGSRWTDRQRETLRAAQEVIQTPNGGIVALIGPRGVGKTLLAAAIAHNARAAHTAKSPGGVGSARYWVLADLFASEKRSWVAGRSGWERVQRFEVSGSPLDDAHGADLLVLDEVQEIAESDWEARELTRLIDARYRACRSTVLVGNLHADELGKRLGPSVLSRLLEGGAMLTCSWPSFRVPAEVAR